MAACKDYGLTQEEASTALKQVQAGVAGWQEEAKRLKIPQSEQDLMATAFQT